MTSYDEYLDRVVTVSDAQELGFCVRGQRKMWRSLLPAGEEHVDGVTFRSFLEEGVTVRWLINTRNPYALRLVDYMILKWSSNG